MAPSVTTESISEPNEDFETTVERYCGTFFEWCNTTGSDVGYEPGHLGVVEGLLGTELSCPPYDEGDLVNACGCWVGEVCRRACGGEWGETPDGGLGIHVDGEWADPFEWVEDCLHGDGSLTTCYEEFCGNVPPGPD